MEQKNVASRPDYLPPSHIVININTANHQVVTPSIQSNVTPGFSQNPSITNSIAPQVHSNNNENTSFDSVFRNSDSLQVLAKKVRDEMCKNELVRV